jgi:NADH-quinone oxidoreductase subunit H
MQDIVEGQRGHGLFGFFNGFAFNPLLFPIWVMFLISSMAETQRAPFDLPKRNRTRRRLPDRIFLDGLRSVLAGRIWQRAADVRAQRHAVLGWLSAAAELPFYAVPGIIWLLLKIAFGFFVFSWVKATVPRYRYDQLMRLGWKVFLPVSLLFVFLVSGWLMATGHFA